MEVGAIERAVRAHDEHAGVVTLLGRDATELHVFESAPGARYQHCMRRAARLAQEKRGSK